MSNFIRTETFLYIILGANLFLLILYIINTINSSKVKKQYKGFMKKLGNGTDIDEILRTQAYKVEDLDKRINEVFSYCERLDKDMETSIQRVGIVRYRAFKDVGSDLSFALALLDENNNGVVLNGLYSSEASNIYAKPVIKGESTYTITTEERQALDIAINSNLKR